MSEYDDEFWGKDLDELDMKRVLDGCDSDGDEYGNTALTCAVIHDNAEIARLLLAAGANA